MLERMTSAIGTADRIFWGRQSRAARAEVSSTGVAAQKAVREQHPAGKWAATGGNPAGAAQKAGTAGKPTATPWAGEQQPGDSTQPAREQPPGGALSRPEGSTQRASERQPREPEGYNQRAGVQTGRTVEGETP